MLSVMGSGDAWSEDRRKERELETCRREAECPQEEIRKERENSLVCKLNGFFILLEREHDDHWAENLLLNAAVLLTQARNDSGTVEKSLDMHHGFRL